MESLGVNLGENRTDAEELGLEIGADAEIRTDINGD